MCSPGKQGAVLQGPRGTDCVAEEAPLEAGLGVLCLQREKKKIKHNRLSTPFNVKPGSSLVEVGGRVGKGHT